MLKLIKVSILIMTCSLLSANAGVGQKCGQPGSLTIGDSTEIDLTLLNSRITVIHCKENILKDKIIADTFLEDWKQTSDLFCRIPENAENCIDGLKINPTSPNVKENLIEYIMSRDEKPSMKVNSNEQATSYLCFTAFAEELFSTLFEESKSVQDAKQDIDYMLSLLGPKHKVIALRELFAVAKRRRLWNPNLKEKFSYLLSKFEDTNVEFGEGLHTELSKIAKWRRLPEETRKKSIDILGIHAKSGDLNSKLVLESFGNERTPEIKLYAEEVLADVNATPVATPTPTDFVSDATPAKTDQELTPPNCGDWSDQQKMDALYLSDQKISSFQSFFQSNYEVNLSTYGINEGDTQSSFEKFLELVTPNPEDPATNTSWFAFKSKYKSANPSLDSSDMDKEANQIYCRMYEMQEILKTLKEKPGNVALKVQTLRLVSQLPSKDAWYLIDRSIDSIDDYDVMGQYISVLRDLGTDKAQKYLDKLFIKSERLRPAVIEAFRDPSIKLLANSKIIEELQKSKENPKSQELLKTILEILEKDEAERKEKLAKQESLDSIKDLPVEEFNEKVKSTYLSSAHNFSDKNVSELDTILTESQAKKLELEKKIRDAQAELVSIHNDGIGDSSNILTHLRRDMEDLQALKEKVFHLETYKKLAELNALSEDSPDIEASKIAIITSISEKLRRAQSSSSDDGNAAVLAAIKDMIISDAYAVNDHPNGDPDVITGNGGDDALVGSQGNDHVIADDGHTSNAELHNPVLEANPKDPVKESPIEDGGTPVKEDSLTGSNTTPTTPSTPSTSSNVALNSGPEGDSFDPKDVVYQDSNSNTGGFLTPPTINTGMLPSVSSKDITAIEKVVESDVVEVEETVIEEKPKKRTAQIQIENNTKNKVQDFNNNVATTNKGTIPVKENRNENNETQKVKKEVAKVDSKISGEISDLQSEIDQLKASNSELAKQEAREVSKSKINRNFAVASPEATQAFSGKNSRRSPASVPVGESGGTYTPSSSSENGKRTPSSNKGQLGTTNLEDGQIDISSLGSEFVKDIENSEIKGWEHITVFVSDPTQEQSLLSLLSSPETASCEDLKFLDTFFENNISKVKFNKKGDAELLVKSGSIPMRVTKPSEDKVKAIQDKYCKIAQNESANTRHTASIGADLENLPEEDDKPIERKRSESSTLSNIIDGVKSFFD